nr:hypothetical protein [Pseudonocardia abyssalis]
MLADIRGSGYAVSDRQVTDDSLLVAAPVHDGRPRGGGVAGPGTRLKSRPPHRRFGHRTADGTAVRCRRRRCGGRPSSRVRSLLGRMPELLPCFRSSYTSSGPGVTVSGSLGRSGG